MTAQFLNEKSARLASSRSGQDGVILDALFSDSVDLTNIVLEFTVQTTAGDVKVTTVAGTTLVIPNIQIGQTVKGPIARILVKRNHRRGPRGSHLMLISEVSYLLEGRGYPEGTLGTIAVLIASGQIAKPPYTAAHQLDFTDEHIAALQRLFDDKRGKCK